MDTKDDFILVQTLGDKEKKNVFNSEDEKKMALGFVVICQTQTNAMVTDITTEEFGCFDISLLESAIFT
jgi:hypothetical protein